MLSRFLPFLACVAIGAARLVAATPGFPVISEFMAANSTTLFDEDRAASDWIEIHNPGPGPVDLAGWHLTDTAKNKTKWAFPALQLPARGYLVVFASGKDRRDPTRPLHANFALDADGEYLALVRPDGVTVASEFAPAFPAQRANVSYGAAGFFSAASPGYANVATLLGERVSFSRLSGVFAQTFALALSGAGPGQRIRYELAAPSAVNGSVPQPTPASPEYRGPIAIDASAVVCAAVFSEDDTASGVPVTAHFVKLDASMTTFSSQLPVLVIDNLGAGPLGKDGIDHPSWVHAYAAQAMGAATFGAGVLQTTPAGATVRGASSADFPKKGYNLKLRDECGASRSGTFLGLAAAERWALVAPWAFDHNYVNNAFMYALSNRLGRWAPQTRFVEVFFNADGGDLDRSDYAGVYVLTERIEPGETRVDIAEMKTGDQAAPAITGGYILKIDARTSDEFGWNAEHPLSANGESSVILVSPSTKDSTAAQRDYIREYVRRMENALLADHASGWKQRTSLDYIDRASWVDHHLLNTFACNPDAFVRSAYFTKDRGGKLRAGPLWDFDRALGSYFDGRSYRHDVWEGDGGTHVWNTGWWGLLAQDPEFMQAWIDRWQSLRRTELSDRNLAAVIDVMTAQVGVHAAARDAARWPDNMNPYGSYTMQVQRMKSWVTQRGQWIDAQFVAAPAVRIENDRITFTPPDGAELVYTLDGSDPRSLGGGMAPEFYVTRGALTVDASANVHVRSYRAEAAGVFPGSPWSSAVGGAASSPLEPRARIVNLSSRALVGTGEGGLIAGVVVADTEAKSYLVRGIGPGLASFGAAGAVRDPRLTLFNGGGAEIARNRGWETGSEAASMPSYARAVGAFPLAPGSADSALAGELAAGRYTVEVSTAAGETGAGLAELYELDDNGRTMNLSTRAQVRGDDGVLIGGFVVQGPAYQRVLLRAVGPTLAALGVSTPLADPVLTLFSGNRVVATNDRWAKQPSAAAVYRAAADVGAFPLPAEGEDAALLVTLPPGAYTVQVEGKAGAEGVALLEIYAVP